MYRIFFLIAFLVTPIYLVITRVIASIIYVTTHIVKKIHKWAKPYMFLLFSPCYHLCYLVLLSLRHALHSIMCCGGCAQRRARRKATITERQHQREGEEGEATSPTATATATATAKKRKSRTHAHAHRQETQDMSASLRIRPYAPPMTNSTLPSSFSSPSELSTLAARETDIPSPIPFSAPQPPSVQLAQSASLSSLSGMAASVPSSAPSTLLAPELSSWGLPEPHTFSFVNRDGIVIVYHVLGNPEAKSTIMLANGLGGKTFMLLVPLIHHFGWTDWKYVTWQYRGLFDNDATDGSIRIRKISVREHSDDCKEVMQKMGLSTVDIMIGWSMGVQVVLEFAVSYPDAVQHLILMNGSHGQVFETVFQPLFRVPGCPYLFRSAIAFLKDHPSLLFYLVSLLWRGQKLFHKVWLSIYCYLFEDRYLRQLMDRCHYQHIHPREEKKEQRMSADDLHTTQCPHHSFLFEFLETFVLDIVTNPYQYLCMFSELHTHSVYHRLSELSHPVLIIGGGLDLLSPVYQCWEMSHALQHARCCVYMDSGHVTLLEKSKKAVADIVSWLGDASLDRHPNRDPHAQHMAKTAALKQTIMRESSQMSLHTLTQRSIVMNTGQA